MLLKKHDNTMHPVKFVLSEISIQTSSKDHHNALFFEFFFEKDHSLKNDVEI